MQQPCCSHEAALLHSPEAPPLCAPLVQGMDAFCQRIRAAGASGLLVPDIALEETGDIRAACGRAGLELVLLTTPTTPKVFVLGV